GGGSRLELEHGTVVVNFLRRDPHLLAEQLSQFVGHQAIIEADWAGLRAPPAQVAAVRKLDEPRHQGPVQLDVAVLPGGEETAPFDALEIEPPQDFGAERRAI